MSDKLIVESKVKALLLKLPGVKSIGQEILDKMSDNVRMDIERSLENNRLTPSGRLLLWGDDKAITLESRIRCRSDWAAKEVDRLCARAKETLAANGGERMESTTDWRMAVFNGETELGLEAWRSENG